MAKKSADAEPGRIQQIRMVAGIVRKSNPRALPLIAAAGLGILVICVVIGLIFHLLSFLIPLGILLGVLAAMILFGRFAQSAQLATIEGQPGDARHRGQPEHGRGAPGGRAARGRPGRRGLPERAGQPAGGREEAGLPGRLRGADL
jgi:hypothetical protein